MAGSLVVVLTASVVSAVLTGVAAAAGPSVPLPGTPSTPVTEQEMESRAPDQATTDALHGDQPAGGATKDGGGTSRATPLKQSATWDVSEQTGDFSWSYPLRVPPAPGGFEPEFSLSYASSEVDGVTSATNNQASWAGDGWNVGAGFVERTYGACADDKTGGTTPPDGVGDLCWRSDNAVAAFAAGGGQLIRDDATGGWRAKADDGSRVERLTGAANGDDDGEHWQITTAEGTRYLFGSRPGARSTWTVPVFGDDVGEPCHNASFGAAHCTQAWRWNLDRVVDRHGNTITYDYAPEWNSYGMNKKSAAVPYVRGGTLEVAEYGLHEGSDQPATGRVEFTAADRCVPGSDCVPDKKDNWPDVPWSDKCDTATCADRHSPSFWSTKRLAKVTTGVRSGSGYADVDSWTLDHQFPAPGDGEKAALWLKSVTHTGHAGAAVSLPPVTFEGTKMPNRVEKVDGLGPLLRYRVTGIVSEAGGVTTVDYAEPDCSAGSLPAAPETNTRRCFPQRWAKRDFSERTDHFHKYVVAQVVQSDRIAANTEQVTSYEYLGGAAWGYDASEFTKEEHRTWNDFRGFGRVRTRQGKPTDPSGPVTMTEQRFHRGLDGDRLPSGKRSVTVTDSEGGTRRDDDWLRGQQYESLVHDGEGDRVVSKTISTPAWQGPTSTRGAYKAYIVRPGTEVAHTALEAGGWRTTRTERTYDDRGQLVATNDLGDTSTDTDDRCTTTTYARNTDRWLLTLPSRVETVAAACGTTPVFPADAISDTRTAYDGRDFGATPDRGNATRAEVAAERPASGPVYAPASTAGFDVHGRTTSAGDALGRVTTTRFTPETGGPVTATATTNPAGHTTTTALETSFGQPVAVVDANGRKTETVYDALGRKTEVWLPNRPRGPGVGGNHRFAYTYRNDAPTVVTSSKLGPNGDYTTGAELYDGLLRLRQAQTPAVGGGRLVVDARYDSQGRKHKVTAPYFTDALVDDRLWVANDVDVPMHVLTRFDGAGRPVAEIAMAGATEKWRSTTAHGGDRVHVTPPAGGTATTTVTDARGRTAELRQYHGPEPEGAFDRTTYRHTHTDLLAEVVDPAGNTWRNSYDLRGRKVLAEDPDRGRTTMGYDDAGQLVSTTDARGATLTNTYDELGRKRSTRHGGVVLAEWAFDTAPMGKGLPASSTRYEGGEAYTSQVLGYSALNSPLGTRVTIPRSEGRLAGTYTAYTKYNVDGSTSSTTYPKIGDLAEEAVQHSYDGLGLPTTTSGGFNGATSEYVTGTEHTRYGEVARVQLGGGTSRVWLSRYHDANTRRVERTTVDVEAPSPLRSDVRYTYDPAGNITSIADRAPGGPADVQCFRADHLRRLTEAWTPGSGCDAEPGAQALAGPAPYRQSFTYDPVGNRLTETLRTADGETTRTATHTGHRVDAITTTDPSGATTKGFTHDATGNTTARGDQRLDWDAEGNLTRVAEGEQVTAFVYTADGDRLIRRDPNGTTLYLAGQELTLTEAGGLRPTRHYRHGDQVVAVRDASGLTWLAGDHQNTSTTAVTSGGLSVVQRRQLPFGAPRGGLVDFPGGKGFVGGTPDASTGLTHLGAREYDPVLGRFVSVDPVMDPADPQQVHGYTYGNNNPVTNSDPTGLFFGKLLKKAVDFVDRHKNTIAFAMGLVALCPLVTPGMAGLYFIGGLALSLWDTAQSAKAETPKQRVNLGLNFAGALVGGVGAGIKSIGRAASANTFGGTPSGGALDGSIVRGKQALAADASAVVYTGAGARLSNHPDNWGMPTPGSPAGTAPAPFRPSWNCYHPDGANGPAGPHPCIEGYIMDPMKNSYCNFVGASPECAKWDAEDHFRPRAPYRPGKSPKTFYQAKWGPKKVPASQWVNPSGPGWYMSNDGMHHRTDGRGRAWF
ncbi:RHS repeat-associated core domain-containing protein [Saccharothrix xinjiangensis]|uniref:RHS repeat-associated core domain-containing protein n=1 Tax=Saccharothrix xinjiangensis TaxID=204798 RepID=A0ABV9Y607_9PSEU